MPAFSSDVPLSLDAQFPLYETYDDDDDGDDDDCWSEVVSWTPYIGPLLACCRLLH